MSNKTRLQTNNTNIQSLIDKANTLPDVSPGVDTSDATAAATDILDGKTAYISTGVTSGTMPNNGAVYKTLGTRGTSYTIPEGYHNGSGRVSIITEQKYVTPTESQQTITPSTSVRVLSEVTVYKIPSSYKNTSDATATADDIMSGKTAYADGEKVTGNFSLDSELSTQDNLISQIMTALEGKAGGGSGGGTFSEGTITCSSEVGDGPGMYTDYYYFNDLDISDKLVIIVYNEYYPWFTITRSDVNAEFEIMGTAGAIGTSFTFEENASVNGYLLTAFNAGVGNPPTFFYYAYG